MARKPLTALRVGDVEASVRFYCDALGFALDWIEPAGAAQVSPPAGLPLLLAKSGVTVDPGWVNEMWREARPGQRLYLMAPADLSGYSMSLLERGIATAGAVERTDGSALLEVSDPDGYPVSFWQAPPWTDDEIVERYAAGPSRLEEAVGGLMEAHLDLVRAPGKWSIRQTVHHCADSEATSLVRILTALAEPRREFKNNPYSQDRWVAALGSDHRPIQASLALIHAIRAHVGSLVRLPGALDRTLEGSLTGTVSVREMVRMLASHLIEHTEQVLQRRRVHEC